MATKIIGIRTPVIRPGEDLVKIMLESLPQKYKLENGDVVVFASSVVSTSQNRIRKVSSVKPSKKAREIAKKSKLDPKLAQIILDEADRILGYGKKCILTIKDEMLRINAGVDHSNVNRDHVTLLPENPDKTSKGLRKRLERKTDKKIGVILSDSHVIPLRKGTIGQAIGSSGVSKCLDCRNKQDLFGKDLEITFRGIADQLATAAQLEMGETDESIPSVIIRGTKFANPKNFKESQIISPDNCVYSDIFNY